MNETKSKRLTIPILQKRLDSIFSEYIRLRDANENGFCKCITCSSMWRWQLIQNGHFIDRRHIKTRYDERNCNSCCYHCNVVLRGNLNKYRLFIIDRYGKEVLEELEAGRHSIEKWNISDYQEKINYYSYKVKQLKLEKGL